MRRTLLLLALVTAVVSLVAWSRPAPPVGPPWLSLELPANPLDRETRGSAMAVRVFHHDRSAEGTMRGMAEGIVDGKRRSIPLEFNATSEHGRYAIPQVWPATGEWVLTINASSGATLLVHLGANGGFQSTKYYGSTTTVASMRSVQVVEGLVSDRRIDDMLRQSVRTAETP